MKSSNKTGLNRAMVLAVAILTAMPAAAHTVRSRPAPGAIETLDIVARTLTLSASRGKAPTELALTSRTKFIHDWRFASASELKPGTLAVVYYRTPFFGRPFVTKVVWLNGG